MNKILIIGGCGYIGSKLNAYLDSKGYAVTSVDLEIFGNPGVNNIKEKLLIINLIKQQCVFL